MFRAFGWLAAFVVGSHDPRPGVDWVLALVGGSPRLPDHAPRSGSDPSMDGMRGKDMKRRTFLKGAAGLAAASLLPFPVLSSAPGLPTPGLVDPVVGDDTDYLQGIINEAARKTALLGVPCVVLFPSGRYQIRRTLQIPAGLGGLRFNDGELRMVADEAVINFGVRDVIHEWEQTDA